MLDLSSSASTLRRKNLKYVAFPGQKETVFEKKPGVHSVEIESGFSQVCIFGLSQSLSRIQMLEYLAKNKINIDFLKLTIDGLSFIIKDQDYSKVESIFEELDCNCKISPNRSILVVHAVNLRDEEGLIAEILAMAVVLGVELDHVGDTHNKLLLVTSSEQTELLSEKIQKELIWQ